MARKLTVSILVLGIIVAAALWFLTKSRSNEHMESTPPDHKVDLANGKTMFDIGGCVSCHTDSKEDRTRLGGGVALASPFGTFYTPNISPDPDDGIGRWTPAQFVTAMRGGISPEGEHLYPSFPYTSYRRMTAGDLLDMFAYIKTLPPVKGKARDHDLPFPFNIRAVLGGWKLLFLNGGQYTPAASRDAQWNRGAYLVNGPGHCAECHSPRNALGGILDRQRFAGGPSPEGQGWVPNITQQGLASWSAGDIAEFLKSGMTPEFDSAGGSMTAVIRNTAQLSDADRTAMAAYIKSLPAVAGPLRPAKK